MKGSLLKLWLRFTTARFADKFARMLVTCGMRDFSEPHTAIRPSKEKLRRILFVSDNMWERRELLPELRRIAEVDFVDTRMIRAKQGNAEKPIELDDFVRGLDPLEKHSYDLIVVYLRSSLLSPDLLNFLRKTWHAPLVGLNLDDKTSFEHLELLDVPPCPTENGPFFLTAT